MQDFSFFSRSNTPALVWHPQEQIGHNGGSIFWTHSLPYLGTVVGRSKYFMVSFADANVNSKILPKSTKMTFGLYVISWIFGIAACLVSHMGFNPAKQYCKIFRDMEVQFREFRVSYATWEALNSAQGIVGPVSCTGGRWPIQKRFGPPADLKRVPRISCLDSLFIIWMLYWTLFTTKALVLPGLPVPVWSFKFKRWPNVLRVFRCNWHACRSMYG